MNQNKKGKAIHNFTFLIQLKQTINLKHYLL